MREGFQVLRRFPWRNTASVLRERFREDRLGLTASSLTFTTVIALVPLVTLILAVFTAFPVFSTMQNTLQTSGGYWTQILLLHPVYLLL